MMFSTDESILDLIRPPDGYRFERGVWVTHDLCTGALVDLVLPALAGVSAAERRVRRSAPGALPDAHLAILAAGDRISLRAIPPRDLTNIVPIVGRRLHAKFVVMQYERETEPLSGSSAKRIFRALVTSANLTQGGLCRNREVWVYQDTPSTAGRTSSLSAELLLLTARLLARQPKSVEVKAALQTAKALEEGLPRGVVASRRITHSLTATPRAGLLAATGLTASPARRVAIVTPAFASESSLAAVRPFGRMLNGADVEIYVSTDRTRAEIESGAGIAFSNSVLQQIRQKARSLRICAVPADSTPDDGTSVRRPLHAKLLLVLLDGELHVLAGSANLTARGMGGLNSELLVYDTPHGGESMFESILHTINGIELPAVRVMEAPAEDDGDLPLSVTAGPNVRAIFEPASGSNAGMRRLHGTLTLDGDLSEVVDIRANGLAGKDLVLKVVARQAVILEADAPALRILFRREWHVLLVTNSAALDGAFWNSKVIDSNDEMVNADVLKFLLDVKVAAPQPRGAGRTAPASVILGKFSLPFERRLPTLAKALPYLRSTGAVTRHFLDEMLDQYFSGHPDERTVAAVMANCLDGRAYNGGSRLLSSLEKHLQQDQDFVGVR
jgi:hypothetical protein